MGKRVSGNILVERKICRKNENGHVCHFHSMSLLCWHFSNHFCLVFCTIACVRARCVPITKGSPHWRICFCATISRTISTIRPISWSQKQRFRRVLQTMNGHDTCSILVNMCIADYINIWFHSAYKVIFVFTCTLYARKGNLNHLQFGWSNKLVGFCLQHFVQTFVDTRVFLYNFQCFGTSKLLGTFLLNCSYVVVHLHICSVSSSFVQYSEDSHFSRSFPTFCCACEVTYVIIGHFNRSCYLLTAQFWIPETKMKICKISTGCWLLKFCLVKLF